MEYFNLLHFKKEPFSNSPEPEFLFEAPQYNACLQMLELAVRLRRGLNIVIGDVGTGKTTLCRKLIQNLSAPVPADSPEIDTFLLLDPAVENPYVFVKTVAGILGISDISTEDSEWNLKEKIKKFLFDKGVDEQRIIVLIIDEGQKIPDDCLEILREFLNYETNSCKLLQIVIFAQPELEKSLAARANLLDRVNYLNHLKPMSFRQMERMIEYRISVARQEMVKHPIFTFSGMLAIYLATSGYPRKVVSLCHHVLLKMIIRGKSKANWFLVESCIGKMIGPKVCRRITWTVLTLLILAALVLFTTFYFSEAKNNKNLIQIKNAVSGTFLDAISFLPSSSTVAQQEIKPRLPDYIPLPAVENSGLQHTSDGLLGAITGNKEITLWRVIDNIYGDTGQEIIEKFVLVNPQLKNLDKMSKVTDIQVPLLPEKAKPVKKDTIIVALEKSKDLGTIYYSLLERKDRGNLPAVLLLSFANKREGRQFAIALNKSFASVEAAQEAVQQLPAELAKSAQVLSQWDEDTILFNRKYTMN